MCRFTDRIVRSGLVIAWRLATSPTSTSPPFEKATTDGVVRDPSELGMTTGSPASRTETTEFVVPRSMPTALGMGGPPGRRAKPVSPPTIDFGYDVDTYIVGRLAVVTRNGEGRAWEQGCE